jgi:hypothetical protein
MIPQFLCAQLRHDALFPDSKQMYVKKREENKKRRKKTEKPAMCMVHIVKRATGSKMSLASAGTKSNVL